jgi:hypothetical protein
LKNRFNPGLAVAKAIIVIILIIVEATLPIRPALAEGPTPTPGAAMAQTPCPADTTCAGAPSLQVDPIWWNNHKINQIGPDAYALASQLISNPYNTCGPATLTMVMNFLDHLKDPASPDRISITDVLQTAEKLGYYKTPENDGSLGVSDLRDIAKQFGFKQVYPKKGSSFLTYSDFLDQLHNGYPAIAGMRFSYDQQTGEYQPTADPIPWNHYAVILGYTDDGKYLWMLNPHPGRGLRADADVHLQLIAPETFRASFIKNDGSETSDYGEALFLR